MKSIDPNGSTWIISRRWFPRWALPAADKRIHWWRGKLKSKDAEGLADSTMGDLTGYWILILIGIAIFVFVLLPILLLVFDVIVVIILTLFGILGRVLFRRPWVIEAQNDDGRTVKHEVFGWFESKREMERLKNNISNGVIEVVDPDHKPFQT